MTRKQRGAGGRPSGTVPARAAAWAGLLPTALVVFFAARILRAVPGNVLALLCLALMGLTVGSVLRREGLRSSVSLAMLLAVALALLAGLTLR